MPEGAAWLPHMYSKQHIVRKKCLYFVFVYIRCEANHGYRMPASAMINISYGERKSTGQVGVSVIW